MELTLKHYGEIIVSYSRIVIAKGLTDLIREKRIGVLGSKKRNGGTGKEGSRWLQKME
jgi:hypothetical protein